MAGQVREKAQEGDGNCLFRAIASEVGLGSEGHKKVRGLNPESSPHTFFSFGAFAALAKAFAGNEFEQNPHGGGPNLGQASHFEIFEAQAPIHHQLWLGARWAVGRVRLRSTR